MSNLMRAFLQTFLLHPSMPESEVMAHLSRLALAKNPDKPASPSDLDPIIAAANTTLADLELEIVVTRDQRTGERIFTYANLHSTPSTRPATALPATDVALFRGIIDFIFTNEEKMGRNEFWITPREATNDAYPRDPQNRVVVSRVQVLEKLNTLVAYGWLVKSDGGRDSDDDGGEERFGLSNRALAELAPFIKDRIASTGPRKRVARSVPRAMRFSRSVWSALGAASACTLRAWPGTKALPAAATPGSAGTAKWYRLLILPRLGFD